MVIIAHNLKSTVAWNQIGNMKNSLYKVDVVHIRLIMSANIHIIWEQ